MLKTLTKHAKTVNGLQHDENQYLTLIKDIINDGSFIEGRNGNTLTIFGSAMHFSLENNVIPLMTTKKLAWKTCLKELLWFIRGSTNNEELQKQNVRIWNDNACREFLDSRGLQHLKENDLGPVYGHQWRFFNAEYTDCHTEYNGKGVDQLKYIIDNLKHPVNRYSRRLIMSAWNPCQIDQMALPPCHVLAQFNVIGDKLSCSLYQRSGDVGLGVPFNIASYSFLTHLLAKHCGLVANEFIYYLGNSHIYDDHITELTGQLNRTPYTFPTLTIKNTYEDINNYTIQDFEVNNYVSHDTIKMKMRQ
jgi:thymidylate synthase